MPGESSVVTVHWLHGPPCIHCNCPRYAFLIHRDAEEAVRRRDGVDFLGYRIRCEIAKGGDSVARSDGRRPVSQP